MQAAETGFIHAQRTSKSKQSSIWEMFLKLENVGIFT
jgi:hypothetical protein